MSAQKVRKIRQIPAPKVKKASPTPSRKRWFFVWLALTGVGVLSAMAGAILAVSLSATPLRQALLSPEDVAFFKEDGAIALSKLRFPELTRPVNILVLGTKVLDTDVAQPSTAGYHALVDSFEGLTDTMLLVRFDPNSQKLRVLSIPRDTQAYIENYGLTKINAANQYGGPALAARVLSDLLEGVAIDRYIRVNVQGVEKLVDALGGVTVYVPKDMKYTDNSQHLYIDLKQGKQHLDGNKSMQFLRFRYDKYGDIGRVQRQQMLMRAIVEQVLRPTTLLRVPQIVRVIQSNIDTNLSLEELAALAGFAVQTPRENVQMLLLPGEFNGTGQKEVSYWLPDRRRIRALVAEHFGRGEKLENTREAREVRVAVQDSTGDPEAVETLLESLRDRGYNRVFVGEPWHEPLPKSRILAQGGDEASAKTLQNELQLGDVLLESTGELNSDVTIQLGDDWRTLRSR